MKPTRKSDQSVFLGAHGDSFMPNLWRMVKQGGNGEYLMGMWTTFTVWTV
jgi:hypothetical protein